MIFWRNCRAPPGAVAADAPHECSCSSCRLAARRFADAVARLARLALPHSSRSYAGPRPGDQGGQLAAWLRDGPAVGPRRRRHGGQPRVALRRRLRSHASGDVGQAAAAVARSPQADPLVRLRRRRPGVAGGHILPAGRPDSALQREFLSRAVARPVADRPGPVPGPDRTARSAAQCDGGQCRRGARAATVEHRDAVSVPVACGGSGQRIDLQSRGGPRGAHSAHAAGVAANRRGTVAAPRRARDAAEVDSLRRLCRHHRG